MACTHRSSPRRTLRLTTVLALLVHVSLLGWHGGTMASSRATGAYAVATVIICAGGALKEVSVNADGVPTPGQAPSLETVCPLCGVLASSQDFVAPNHVALALRTRAVGASSVRVANQRVERRPDVRHGQDPPSTS